MANLRLLQKKTIKREKKHLKNGKRTKNERKEGDVHGKNRGLQLFLL
jgi:hypothetical protein